MVEKRKFINQTAGFIGVVTLDDDNKRRALPVEPGGEVWLSETEEKLTAEAPRLASDNPFIKAFEFVTGHDALGEPITETRHGQLVPSSEPARPVGSDRFTPSGADRGTVGGTTGTSSALPAQVPPVSAQETPPAPPTPAPAPEEVTADEEVTGAPPVPQGPPPQGAPAPGEIVATPEAIPANDEELARRAAAEEQAKEQPTPIPPAGRPADTSQIRTPPPIPAG